MTTVILLKFTNTFTYKVNLSDLEDDKEEEDPNLKAIQDELSKYKNN